MGNIFCSEPIRGICKVLLRIVTQKCEIQRICSSGPNTALMTSAVARSFGMSKQMRDMNSIVLLHTTEFDPNELTLHVIQRKAIPNSDTVVKVNLRLCLDSILIANLTYQKITTLKNTAFDQSNEEHVYLLNSLWSNLFPDKRRKSNDIICDDWTEIGFQNRNPVTDLRGMGILSLVFLHNFTKNYNSQSRSLLLESLNPQRYFPFSAVGINLASFIMDLLNETRLDTIIYDTNIPSVSVSVSSGGTRENTYQIDRSIQAVCDVFSNLYIEFGRQWVAANPKQGVMAFPAIFKTFQKSIKDKKPRQMNVTDTSGIGSGNSNMSSKVYPQ